MKASSVCKEDAKQSLIGAIFWGILSFLWFFLSLKYSMNSHIETQKGMSGITTSKSHPLSTFFIPKVGATTTTTTQRKLNIPQNIAPIRLCFASSLHTEEAFIIFPFPSEG